MNQLAALIETVDTAAARGHDFCDFGIDAANHAHLRSMVDRAEAGTAAGTFSDAKLGRWLGYVQGVLVAQDVITLDEAKDINRRHAGSPGETGPGPLTHGPFSATPEAAIEAAHLLSVIEHAVWLGAMDPVDLWDVVGGCTDGRHSIDAAIEMINEAIQAIDTR